MEQCYIKFMHKASTKMHYIIILSNILNTLQYLFCTKMLVHISSWFWTALRILTAPTSLSNNLRSIKNTIRSLQFKSSCTRNRHLYGHRSSGIHQFLNRREFLNTCFFSKRVFKCNYSFCNPSISFQRQS